MSELTTSKSPESPEVVKPVDAPPERAERTARRRRGFGLAGFVVLLTGAFSVPLYKLALHALATEMHSHVILVPCVTGWLLWTDRQHLQSRFKTSLGWGVILSLLGIFALVAAVGALISNLSPNDYLSLMTASYLCFLVAGAFLFLGAGWVKKAAFPVFFLVFMIPLPDGAVVTMEHLLVLGSAEATDLLFQLSGTPVFRVEQAFHLPGFSLEVAQECSGIRSSWVLFITSLLASHLFLRTRWRQVLLVAMVIPLGLVRNGLRILVIGLLCVHTGPHMIDSWIHNHGGPVFFALSLIPLFLLLWWLRWSDLRAQKKKDGGSISQAEDEVPATPSS